MIIIGQHRAGPIEIRPPSGAGGVQQIHAPNRNSVAISAHIPVAAPDLRMGKGQAASPAAGLLQKSHGRPTGRAQITLAVHHFPATQTLRWQQDIQQQAAAAF